jgi:hypothetical protein
MIIILKNIPAKTKKQDIKNFITPAVNGSWLSKRGEIQNISMLSRKNICTHDIQYHSLVDIVPDSVAKRVIKKLNRKFIVGKCIAVCEYKLRNWHNDPRIIRNTNKRLNNRRSTDRRDKYKEVVSEELTITSKRTFHTKGW